MFRASKWAVILSLLACLLAPTQAASEETYLGQEKIQELVSYFRGQAQLARMVQGWTSSEHYVSAYEAEYFDNLVAVFEQNAAELEKRERVRQSDLEDYFASIDADLKALVWMPELKKTIATHLKLIGTPGLDQERIEKFYRQQRINGEDPQLFYDRIARFSRPEAMKFEEAVLVITGGEEIDPQKDYWIDQSGTVAFTVTNTGEDDANDVTLAFQASPMSLEGVLGNGLSCTGIDIRQGQGRCERGILEPGSEAGADTEIRTELGSRQLDEDWRAMVDLSIRTSSQEPQFETQKQFQLTMRACVRAYEQALDPPLQSFRVEIDKAVAPNAKLPGRALYELPSGKSYLSSPRDAHRSDEVYALIAYLQINRGIDSDLKWLDLSYGPYAPLKTLALQLPRTLVERSRPGEHCQDPAADLSRLRNGVLSDLQARADELRHIHRLLVLAANARMQELQFALEVGQEGTAEGETLEGATQELVFQVLETTLKDLAPYSDELATFLRMHASARTVSRGSNLLSIIEIIRATRALYYVLPEWWEPEYSLALLEALPYAVRLAERYEELATATETYLDAIEAAYTESCTCRDLF